MGAHPESFNGLRIRLQRAKDPRVIDELLDQWFDWKTRATEWDAQQWGFDLDWMKEIRAELCRRAVKGVDRLKTKNR